MHSTGRGTASSQSVDIAKANTNNRRRGTSVPLAGEKKEAIGAFQQHGQQRDKKRDTRTQSGSGHATEKRKSAGILKKGKTKKKKVKRKKRNCAVPPAHTTSLTFIAASGLFFQSSLSCRPWDAQPQGRHRVWATNNKTRAGDTSLITVCSNQKLKKKEKRITEYYNKTLKKNPRGTRHTISVRSRNSILFGSQDCHKCTQPQKKQQHTRHAHTRSAVTT
ncbi:hypothetical protein TcCL_Unassigned01818 [Trypanosoma cruzi]|nr:hypothetical protein TcCL_Unassigned01818 [Trypanosoma cruzi]